MIMQDHELENLLRGAEADLGDAPLDAARLAERVRDRRRRRGRKRRVIATAAPLLLAIGAVGWYWSGREVALPVDHAAQQARQMTAGEEADIERLVAQADFHRRVALRIDALLRQERLLGEARDALVAAEPEAEIREQLEIVAYRMILRADALRAAMEPGNKAAAVYQDIVRLFPNTQSAELARRRLTELSASQGAT